MIHKEKDQSSCLSSDLFYYHSSWKPHHVHVSGSGRNPCWHSSQPPEPNYEKTSFNNKFMSYTINSIQNKELLRILVERKIDKKMTYSRQSQILNKSKRLTLWRLHLILLFYFLFCRNHPILHKPSTSSLPLYMTICWSGQYYSHLASL